MLNRIDKALSNYEGMLDPTFVIGCPRSGTTLLARLIGTNPKYCYLEELRFLSKDTGLRVAIANLLKVLIHRVLAFPDFEYKEISQFLENHKLYKIAKKMHSFIDLGLESANSDEDIERLAKHVLASAYLGTVPHLRPSNPLLEILKLDSMVDHRLVLKFVSKYKGIIGDGNRTRIMFKDFSILTGKEHVIEKTPGEDLLVTKLLDIFPKAKLLHIYRDGRDVVASILFSKNFYGEKRRKPWRKACQIWLASYEAVRILPRICPKNNYMLIRYEDFIRNLHEYAINIFDFINVTLSKETLLKIEEISGKRLKSRWDEDMSEALRKKVSRHLAEGLKALDYGNR